MDTLLASIIFYSLAALLYNCMLAGLATVYHSNRMELQNIFLRCFCKRCLGASSGCLHTGEEKAQSQGSVQNTLG